MPTSLQNAGANLPASDFAPIHVNRMMTGMWSNSNPLRDAATPLYVEKFQGGRQDRIKDGNDCEISNKLTLRRRRGLSVYNSKTFPRINRYYGWNVFTQTTESVRVMVDTANVVYDGTGPSTQINIWNKSPGAGSTYFLGVGNTLYFTNGVDSKQLNNASGQIWNWGIVAPVNAPLVTQQPRPNPYNKWQANTVYGFNTASRSGIVILDNATAATPGTFANIPLTGGGNLSIGCGQNLPSGAAIPIPSGFDNTRIAAWSTPSIGFESGDISGVYQSTNSGGNVASAFQTRAGANAGFVSGNWIAAVWDATAASTMTVTTSGGFTTLVFRTVNGDDGAIVVGSGHHGTSIPVPSGFSLGQMYSICGMVAADNVNHAMQGVIACSVTSGVIAAQYEDGSANIWNGNAGVFALFYKTGQGTTTQGVTNGTSILFPLPSSNNVAFTFIGSILNGSTFGLPTGYTTSNSFITSAISGWTQAGSNNGHGWNCTTSGQTVSAYYRDGSGNQWNAYASAFAVGATNFATGGNMEWFNGNGVTGSTPPSWKPNIGDITTDNTVNWTNLGPGKWKASTSYPLGSVLIGSVTSPAGTPTQVYVATTGGVSNAVQEPFWVAGRNLQIQDGSVIWTCEGHILSWPDIGPSTNVSSANVIADPNGYLQQVSHQGKTGTTPPQQWQTELGALTEDNTMEWVNIGSYAAGGTGAVQYGYAYENSTTLDISNMSPPSLTITVTLGNQVTIQGDGSADPQVDKIVLYRTAQGGSTFLYMATIANPGGGKKWTYIDTGTDADLNFEIQAQVNGEGTPPPAGGTCMEYHLGRIWIAAGNVVYGSSGPDAVVAGSSGNAGFDLSFTAQSKVTRLWANSLGLLVFTVRDVYIILQDPNSGTLYMQKWIEQLPLLSYDAFTLLLTTPHIFTGYRTLVTFDTGAGIVEMSFPIADKVANINPATAYCTFLTGPSGETALYLSDGQTLWYRMAPTSAPESGINWSPAARPAGGMSAVQATEVLPGQTALLVGPASSGPILQRDVTKNTDNGVPFAATADIGSIVLALPGQLAGLAWMTLEAQPQGTAPALGVLLDEIDGSFTSVPRTRQDPTNLPPSTSLQSNRHSLLQNQHPVWCRHMQYSISWPAEDAPNELLTTTIFGQVWQEQRSQ